MPARRGLRLAIGLAASQNVHCVLQSNSMGAHGTLAPVTAGSSSQLESSSGKTSMVVYTALISDYEETLKEPAKCPTGVRFVGYTDRDDLSASDADGNPVANGKTCWNIVTGARELAARLDQTHGLVNSIDRHNSSFNVAKFFKVNPHRLKELQNIRFVVWIDSTVRLKDTLPSLHPWLEQLNTMVVVPIHNKDERRGMLEAEYRATMKISKYLDNVFQNKQPIQDTYSRYLKEGFTEKWWQQPDAPQMENLGACPGEQGCGVWLTCFLAWDMEHNRTLPFLNEWSAAWSNDITQDQITFPYVAWKLKQLPYSLPDKTFTGKGDANTLYLKEPHGGMRSRTGDE